MNIQHFRLPAEHDFIIPEGHKEKLNTWLKRQRSHANFIVIMDKELTPAKARMLEVLESRRFWNAFIFLGAVLLGIGSVRYFMNESKAKKERVAEEKIFQVSQLESEGLPAQTNIFSQEFFKKRLDWNADKKEKMKKLLNEVISEHPTTGAAQSARLRLGVLSFTEANYEEAVKSFDAVISNGTRRAEDVNMWNALIGKAISFEMLKKWNEAITSYDEITKDEKSPLVAEALLGKVRCLTSLGRKDDVAPLLKKLRDDFSGGYYDAAARAVEAYQAR